MSKIGIFVGTVYGNSLAVAEEAQTIFVAQGHEVVIFDEPQLTDWQNYNQDDNVVLIITSTTGQGDLPDSITPLFYEIQEQLGYQPNLRYGIIGLGDSSYDNYCAASKRFAELLKEQSAKQVGELLLIDAIEQPVPEEFAQPWLQAWGKLI